LVRLLTERGIEVAGTSGNADELVVLVDGDPSKQKRDPLDRLTPWEREVLALMAGSSVESEHRRPVRDHVACVEI
jgi:hypothetical protein